MEQLIKDTFKSLEKYNVLFTLTYSFWNGLQVGRVIYEKK